MGDGMFVGFAGWGIDRGEDIMEHSRAAAGNF